LLLGETIGEIIQPVLSGLVVFDDRRELTLHQIPLLTDANEAIEKECDDNQQKQNDERCLHSSGSLTAPALHRNGNDDHSDYQQKQSKYRDGHRTSVARD
jgi:hypothetical protein